MSLSKNEQNKLAGERGARKRAVTRLLAEARQLLLNATFADGQGIILTQDAEALAHAIAVVEGWEPQDALTELAEHTFEAAMSATWPPRRENEARKAAVEAGYGDEGTRERYDSWVALCADLRIEY